MRTVTVNSPPSWPDGVCSRTGWRCWPAPRDQLYVVNAGRAGQNAAHEPARGWDADIVLPAERYVVAYDVPVR